MAASTAGAVKAYVESLGLSLSAYRDGAPTGQDGAITAPYPHVVIQEGIAYAMDTDGDYGDQAAVHTMRETVQVDLYQHARELVAAGGSRNVEDYNLPDRLRMALHGARLGPVGAQHVYGVSVRGGQRWPISDNIVRHTLNLEVAREVNRSS